MDPATLEKLILACATDRWAAHQFLFKHRHTAPSGEIHKDLVRSIYQPGSRQLVEGFRGCAKSTHLEEAAVVKAAYREFNNMVIVGASYARACERLASIKREIEQNQDLAALFGSLKGGTWQEGKIVLANGICIQALGRDQSTVGIKHFDWRPDAALVDDVEDPEEKRTDAEREDTWLWFLRTFLPSLDHPLNSWVRVLGTRRGTGSLPERLENEGWPTVKYPIEYIDADGCRAAAWPGKFPLSVIDEMRKTYRNDLNTWDQEYMCRATHEATRVFTREMLKVEPRPRTWQAVYAMYDPARTVTRTSSTTGKAVWSWINSRLIFWRLDAQLWLPDQIIDDMFKTQAEFNPVWIGFEKTGLSEWAMQPLRQEAVRRGIVLPLKPIDAPRGKIDFIRGLQPFFANREVIFAEEPNEHVIAQFLSFPNGRIDAPNAAAYALLMRPAVPIFDNFSDDNVAQELEALPGRPIFLAANATGGMMTAILAQAVDGQIRVLADWVREGDPADIAVDVHMEAAIEGDTSRPVAEPIRPRDLSEALKRPEHRVTLARMPVRWVLPPRHAERWNNVGLAQAVRAIPAQVGMGAQEIAGRQHLRDLLDRQVRGAPALLVSERATWTLNALAGGYCRAAARAGGVAEHAEEGVYRVLMEGLESFAGMLARLPLGDEEGDNRQNISYSREGTPYRSAMPTRR